MTLQKPPKFRAEAVLAMVRGMTCIRCEKAPGEPHHLPSPWGGTRRAVDVVVPLCRKCHDFYHNFPELERRDLPTLYVHAVSIWVATYEVEWRDVWDLLLEKGREREPLPGG